MNPKNSNILKGFLYLGLTGLYLVLLFRFGIPIAVKIANFVQRDKGKITEDRLAVLPPRLNYLPSATNSAELVVSGYTLPNQKVELYINDSMELQATTDADGYFRDKLTLVLGSNQIFAITVDANGQKSQPSNQLDISFIDIAPDLVVTEPLDNTEIRQKGNTINILGTTEPGVTLRVNNRLGVVDANGSFSFRYALSEGDNTIVVEVTDEAGNKKQTEVNVNYRRR